LQAYSRQSSGPSTGYPTGLSPSSFGVSIGGASTGGAVSRKRSAPLEALTPLGRPLAPKQPSTFGPETTVRPSVTGFQLNSPIDPSPRPNEPRKKRGRPTKQEAEERRRQTEERQQRRMQAQVGQAHQSGLGEHPISAQRLLSESIATVSQMQIGRELPPSHTSQPQALGTETPKGAAAEEQLSSGSSGKKRKIRTPRATSSSIGVLRPQPFSVAANNPLRLSAQELSSQPDITLEEGQNTRSRVSPSTTGLVPTDQDNSRFDADGDNRPSNLRSSRPWEVTGGPGPGQ
jgi:hypothetical protein